jgi:hypothetical protein
VVGHVLGDGRPVPAGGTGAATCSLRHQGCQSTPRPWC